MVRDRPGVGLEVRRDSMSRGRHGSCGGPPLSLAHRADSVRGPLRVGFRGDRPDAGRCRGRQGRAPGGAVADRRDFRTGRFLRDDGCVSPDPGGSIADRRSTRPPVAVEHGRPGVDPDAQRCDSPRSRSRRDPGRCGDGDHRGDRPARRTSRLRRAIERDGGRPADGILRGPARHISEHRRAGGDPRARRSMLGLAFHRARGDLPAAERRRPPAGPDGRGRAADGLPGRVPASCSRPTPSRATGRSPPSRQASVSARPSSRDS